MPDDDEVGNAGNGVPAPLLRVAFGAESGKETSEDHDHVGNDGHEDVGTVEAGEETEIEQQERGGDGPVDVPGKEDLTVDVVLGVGHVRVALIDHNVVVGNAVAGSHGKVRESSEDGDQGGDKVENTLVLSSVSVRADG